MSKFSILKPIAHDLAHEYEASPEIFLSVGDKVIADELRAEFEVEQSVAVLFSENIIKLKNLSASLMRMAKNDDLGSFSEICHVDNGIFIFEIPCKGGHLTVCADPLYDCIFIHFNKEKNELFLRAFLDNLEMLSVSPRSPRLEKYCSNNASDVMRLTLEPMQVFYSCDVKTALCYAYAHGKESFAFLDGKRCVGVLVVGCEGDLGVIDHVAIDKKHQLKGYGKMLIEQALSLFRERGCKLARIAVHEYNDRAGHVYEKMGFSFYERKGESIVLRRNLCPAD